MIFYRSDIYIVRIVTIFERTVDIVAWAIAQSVYIFRGNFFFAQKCTIRR